MPRDLELLMRQAHEILSDWDEEQLIDHILDSMNEFDLEHFVEENKEPEDEENA